MKREARRATRSVVDRAGLLDPARRVREALADERERRKRADHAVLAPLLAAALSRDAVTIDAGAHRGAVLELFLRYAPRGSHYAFEPIPELAAGLRERFPGADVREAAVSDRPGEATFQYFPNHADCSGIDPLVIFEQPQPLAVRTTTLDDEIDPAHRISAIKIDVEGAEVAVLRGATRILREHRPLVVVEHTQAAVTNGVDTAELHGLLDAAGLRVYGFSGEGPLTAADLRCLVADGYENFLART